MKHSLYNALTVSIICFFINGLPAYSQEKEGNPGVISFYLDCRECDFTFVRQELPFVSFVRDPLQADVHILVTESNTGGGGEKFFLNFIGRNDFAGTDFEYTISTLQSDTDDDIRRALLKMLKVGIIQYYSKTESINSIDIIMEDRKGRRADEMIVDRWNKWVFNIRAGGTLDKEESQNSYYLSTSAGAAKITEEWKTDFNIYYAVDQEKYFDDDTTIIDRQDQVEYSGYFVKSLTEKWSAGIFSTYTSRNYINTRHNKGLAAGVEYNFFPWSECNRRVFALQYYIGANYVDYYEKTIYDKMSETLFSEGLEINLDLIQPWGEVEVGLVGRHYFHDFSKTRLTLESDLSVRLTKNLSVFSELRSEIIHDQLYLPSGDASRDDILLRRRKLATTYELRIELGLRFTFGSIFNTVVNERF